MDDDSVKHAVCWHCQDCSLKRRPIIPSTLQHTLCAVHHEIPKPDDSLSCTDSNICGCLLSTFKKSLIGIVNSEAIIKNVTDVVCWDTREPFDILPRTVRTVSVTP